MAVKRIDMLYKYLLAVLFVIYIFIAGVGLLPEAAKQFLPLYQKGMSAIFEVAHNLDSYYNMSSRKNSVGLDRFQGKLFADESIYINFNGLCAKIVGQRLLNNAVKLDNGHLSSVMEQMSADAIALSALSIKEVADSLECPYLYVQAPHHINKYDKQLPIGIYDYSNENADMLLENLALLGVQYLDIRERMYLSGLNQYDYFYRTDHHWTIEGGFVAYRMIMDYLSDKWSKEQFNIEARDITNYAFENYPKWHLGSNGQRVGKFYGGVDDFHLIRPLFKTQLTNMSSELSGSFDDVLISFSALENYDYKSRFTYDSVYGSKSMGHFINFAENVIDKKVMIISDSMGSAVKPFLILSFREVLAVGISSPLQQAEEFHPDIVIDLRIPNNVSTPI